MGSKLSTTRNCVAIWTDKPVYYSGDLVQGYVCLNVIDTFAAGSVDVEIKGYEKTSWIHHETHQQEHRDSRGDVHTHTIHTTHPHGAKRHFFRVSIPLATFSPYEPLPLGQYQFPFRAVLPTNTPGSFTYYDPRQFDNENIHGKVLYKVTAAVVQGPRKGKHAHLHDCSELVVRQRLTRPPSELVAETTTDVKCCCLNNKGMVMLRMRADKDAYTAGETAYLLLEVDNRTSLAFHYVVLKVQRVVSLRADWSSYARTVTIYEHRFPGLAKGSSYMGANAQRLAFPIGADLAPTTQGALVTCAYQAWVELSAGALTNNPRLCVPLTIYAAPPPHEAFSAPPAYWNPQMVYPSVEVKLPSAPPYDPKQAASAPPLTIPQPQYGMPAPGPSRSNVMYGSPFDGGKTGSATATPAPLLGKPGYEPSAPYGKH